MKGFSFKLRFLPAMIFIAALTLTVKIGDIMEDFDGIVNGKIAVSSAEAQVPPTKPAVKPTEPVKPGAPMTDSDKTGAESSTGMAKQEPEPAAEGRPEVTDDPTLLSLSEIDLLQKLAERRELLDVREREMEVEVGLLTAAELRIDKKVGELKVLQRTIEDLLKKHEVQQDAKMVSLVKIYESMKPKEAARIFEEMEMETLLKVAVRMKERKLAPVMAQMAPQKAKEMTVEFSRKDEIPRPGSNAGG